MACRAAALLALAALLPLAVSASLRGLDPALAPRYQPGADGQFSCLDGKKSIPFDRVNDDYCDCLDGSDEPGSSACPNGHFYCENKLFVPLLLNASMVDDGVCDCCDGSDEPASACANTCYEKGHESLASLREQVATAKMGVAGRNAYKQDAEILKDQWQKRKEELEQEVEAARKEQEVADAEQARLDEQKGKLEGRKKELEDKKQALEDAANPAKPAEGEQPPAEEAGDADANAIAAEAEAAAAAAAAEYDAGAEAEADQGEVKEAAKSEEELARERMAQWIPGAKDGGGGAAGDEEAQDQPAYDGEDLAAADAAGALEGNLEEEGQFFLDEGADGGPGGAAGSGAGSAGSGTSGGGGAGGAASAGEGSGAGAEGQPASALGKAKRLLSKVLGALSGHSAEGGSGADVSGPVAELTAEIEKLEAELSSLEVELSPVRTRANEARSQLRQKETEQGDLDKKLGGQYGEDDVFVPLVDKCYSAKVDKYSYEVCPFGQASQKEGHSSTSLGSWEGLEGEGTVMAFRNGAGCWQGPSRSMVVSLRCGQVEKLAKVAEPSRCEYTAELETPAACTPDSLEALQAELVAREKALTGEAARDEL